MQQDTHLKAPSEARHEHRFLAVCMPQAFARTQSSTFSFLRPSQWGAKCNQTGTRISPSTTSLTQLAGVFLQVDRYCTLVHLKPKRQSYQASLGPFLRYYTASAL